MKIYTYIYTYTCILINYSLIQHVLNVCINLPTQLAWLLLQQSQLIQITIYGNTLVFVFRQIGILPVYGGIVGQKKLGFKYMTNDQGFIGQICGNAYARNKLKNTKKLNQIWFN